MGGVCGAPGSDCASWGVQQSHTIFVGNQSDMKEKIYQRRAKSNYNFMYKYKYTCKCNNSYN